MHLILGRRYNRTKKAAHAGENQHTRGEGQNDPHLTTAETLATQYGVSPATVKRAGADAALLDLHPEVAAAAHRKSRYRVSGAAFVVSYLYVHLRPKAGIPAFA